MPCRNDLPAVALGVLDPVRVAVLAVRALRRANMPDERRDVVLAVVADLLQVVEEQLERFVDARQMVAAG